MKKEQAVDIFNNMDEYIKWKKAQLKGSYQPWLVWLSGLNARLLSKESQIRFPVRAHAWVADQVPSRGRMRGNQTLMFPSLSPSLPLSLKINK